MEERLPVDPVTGSPILPRAQPGYYPGFSTLSQQDFWDDATRSVVLNRVQHVPPIRYFSAEELPLITAIIDRIVPQDDRLPELRIPVVNYVDDRLATGRIDGYRFEDMPQDTDAYHIVLRGVDAVAQHMHGRGFVELGPYEQDEVLQTLHDANPPAGNEYWEKAPCDRSWLMLVQDAVDAYYSHPYAWDEIGFGGPAYPRGYFRLENGQAEPWEVNEHRYEWEAPKASLSDVYRPLGGRTHHAGQEGTH